MLTFYPIFILPTLPLWLLPLLQLTLAIPLSMHSLFPRRSAWISALSGPPFSLNLRHSPWASGALSNPVALSLTLWHSPWAFGALSWAHFLTLQRFFLGSCALPGPSVLFLELRSYRPSSAIPGPWGSFSHIPARQPHHTPSACS